MTDIIGTPVTNENSLGIIANNYVPVFLQQKARKDHAERIAANEIKWRSYLCLPCLFRPHLISESGIFYLREKFVAHFGLIANLGFTLKHELAPIKALTPIKNHSRGTVILISNKSLFPFLVMAIIP